MPKEIVLCFLDINSPALVQGSWLNKWAAKVAPVSKGHPKIHCELWFRDPNTETGHACSICYGATVHWKVKTFGRKNWVFRSLYVSEASYNRIKTYCQMAEGSPFNRVGFFLLALGFRISGSWSTFFGYRQSYYCAEIVCHALKAGGILSTDQNCVLHPETLFQQLANNTTMTTIKKYSSDAIKYV
tara:strand:- start:11 stop:568 length:558 start_codon:yes stop_codon:yes gene_type:complete